MAASARKKRAKEMARLGWSWVAHWNTWVWFGWMGEPTLRIEYRPKERNWMAISVNTQVSAHDELVTTFDQVSFDDPIAAAVWSSVEHADRMAAHRKRIEDDRREWENRYASRPERGI